MSWGEEGGSVGGLREPARGWQNRQAWEQVWDMVGARNKETYCVGEARGARDRLESAEGVCLVLGRRPHGVKGSESYMLAATRQACWVWWEVPGRELWEPQPPWPPGTACNCSDTWCCPSLFTLKAAWGGGAQGKIHRGKGLSCFYLAEKFLSCVASQPRVGKVEASH